MAGLVNIGGFLATHRFVSHVTGFATHFGQDLGQLKFQDAFNILSVPIFFLMGAMISGFLIDRRQLLGKVPNYPYVFFFMFLVLTLLAWAGGLMRFGPFGDDHLLQEDYILVAGLALVCGLQNAVVTSASGALVRTTHLTGLTTDLGIGWVRLLSGVLSKEDKQSEWLYSLMRISIILAFIIGSAIGGFLFLKFQYFGFLLPASIALILFFEARKRNKKQQAINKTKPNPGNSLTPEASA